MSRYRTVNAYRRPHHVEHLGERGWCGPLIPSADHPRAGELPEKVICICCGDFCRGVDAETVATVLRLEAAAQRAERRDETRAADLRKLGRAGVDVSALPPAAPRSAPRRREQLALFAGAGGAKRRP